MNVLAALYRWLLRAYPRDFRAAHGDDASRLFAEACIHDWKTAGIGAVVRRVVAALIDVPRSGLAERRLAGAPRPHWSGWFNIGGDVRQAFRSMRRRPALSLTIILTLAVGLGTNVAIFSVIDATLLRPLPYPRAGRVVWIEAMREGSTSGSDPRPSWTRAWTNGHQSFERVEWRVSRSALVTGAAAATRVRMLKASGGYLNAIGARPILGRSIDPGDTATGAQRIAVLSQQFWRDQFGADASLIGRTIAIDKIPHVIVGVASDLESDIAGLTFKVATALQDGDDREPARAVAWLRTDTTLEQAQAALDALPAIQSDGKPVRPRVSRPRNVFWSIQVFRTTELGFLAAALLVLAVAGVNVSHLFLAAGQERAGELTVRRALGAGAFRIARLLFVETMTLAITASAAGLGIAWALIQWLKSLDAGTQIQSRIESISLDPAIAAYAIALGCFAAVAFGLWPAIRSTRQSRITNLPGSTRSSERRRRSSSVLLAIETGLSAVLLIVAGVLGHAFVTMQATPRGFDADRVLRVRLSLPSDRYATPASRATFFNRLAAEASAIPGVERFGLSYGAVQPSDFIAGGTLSIAGGAETTVDWIGLGFVEPGYFKLMGIPLLQGTEAGPQLPGALAADAPQPAVISRSMANRYAPNGAALGAVFQITDTRGVRRFHVVGVAGDASRWAMATRTCADCDPFVYLPMPEQRQFTDVMLRLRPGAKPPVAALQAAVARLDPNVPADNELMTAEAGLRQTLRLPRFNAALFAAFAGIAVVLAAIGLSAVVSRNVAQRTREMGIRLALGATPGSVRNLVVKEGLRPALVGLAAGIVAALGATRTMRALLYGFSSADPLTLVVAPLLLAVIVIAALAIPAVRATRVDPARTLRAD